MNRQIDASGCATGKGCYVVGMGSVRGTPLEVVGQGVMQCLDRYQVDMEDVSFVASIHMKAYDPAYSDFARIHGVALCYL